MKPTTDTAARRAELATGVAYLPTPAKIARECERIQAGWTETERARRRVGPVEELTIPLVAVRDLAV